MKRKRSFKCILAAAISFALAVTSVGTMPSINADAATTKYVKSLKLSKSKIKAKTGDPKITLKSTVAVKGKASKKVKVKSSKSAIVSVKVGKANKKGVSKISLTPKKVGKATITVTTVGKNKKKKKISKKIQVVVSPAVGVMTEMPVKETQTPNPIEIPSTKKEVTQVNVTAAQTSLVVGDTTTATAMVIPSDVATKITWTSSDEAVATVDDNGLIVARKSGNAVITATASNGVNGTITIKVKAISVSGVSLNSESTRLAVGATTTLIATVSPSNATDRRVTWTSSDEKVVKVDSDGTVTAMGEGTATVTVETVDGGFSKTCTFEVVDDSKKDVDKIEANVQNALDDYPNTVLVGTRAQIRVTVTKDGVPFGNDTASLELKGISGYASYYELEKDTIDLNSKGTGTAYVKLKSQYSTSDYDATIDDAKNWSDAAYASLKLTIRAGGADLSKDVSITFGQILIGNENSYGGHTTPAITVNNQHNVIDYLPIERVGGNMDTMLTTVAGANVDEKYYQEYVVDQQVSSTVPLKNHAIEFDASPMLILPSSEEATIIGDYEEKINYTSDQYSVYSGVDSAYTLEEVPGGLQYLTLTFGKIELSPYSKLTIGCYEAGTNIPISGSFKSLSDIQTTESGQTVQIEKSVFDGLQSTDKIDVKIFVESAGQVNEDTNIGYTVTQAKGPYKSTTRKESKIIRLTDDVSWDVEDVAYTAPQTLSNPKAYLGDKYVSGYKYYVSYPTYPATGNAIITVKDTNNNEKDPFLYPTIAEDNANVLAEKNPNSVISATVEEIKPLSANKYTAKVNSNGNYEIDSKSAGYINIVASINTLQNITYKVRSSVQWSPIPTEVEDTAQDFYAVAGQDVQLTAIVKDIEGNLVKDASVVWNYDNESVITNKEEIRTNSNGEAKLSLRSNSALDLTNINAKCSTKYEIFISVADQMLEEDYANIYWIEPGVYYQNKIDGEEYDTLGATKDITTATSSYKVGTTWLLGTKVVGRADDDNRVITNITNIKIGMQNVNEGNAAVDSDVISNGVYRLSNIITGSSREKFALNGYINSNKKCVITVATEKENASEDTDNEEDNYEYKDYVSVGTGDIANGSYALIVPISWNTNGASLSILQSSGTTFAVSNKYDNTSKNIMHAYLKVVDNYDNAVYGQKVTYHITKEVGNDTSDVVYDTEAETDTNGLVDIAFSAPTSACKYTISAFINEEKEVSTTFDFKVPSSTIFTLKADVSDGQNKRIVIKSNGAIDTSVLRNEMFTLKDGSKTVSIESIETGKSAEEIIINTKESFSIDTTVVYNAIVKDGDTNQLYYFVNADGVLYTNK